MLILPKTFSRKPFARYNSREFIKLIGPHVVEYTKGELNHLRRQQKLNLLRERVEEYGLTWVALDTLSKRAKDSDTLLKIVDFDTSEIGVLRLQELRSEFGGAKGEDVRIVVA